MDEASVSSGSRGSLNLRQKLELLRAQLEQERSTFKSHWRDLNDYILPRRGRFFVSDANKGDRRNQKILDTTPTMSARTLSAGMMSGVTSPARPWFRLTVPDQNISEKGEVKEWLDTVQRRMSTSFLRSNLYNILPVVYGDLGVFGTGCIFVEEDFTGEVMRFHAFPIGSYSIAQDESGRVNTFYREFRMTVRQLVNKFGRVGDEDEIQWEKFSNAIRHEYEMGHLETWVDIAHAVIPNKDYDSKKLQSRYKKYASIYYERGHLGANSHNLSDIDTNRYLSISGFDFFPVLAPRWEVTGEDVYGTNCPGMVALGDIKQLQLGEKKVLQAIEKTINPPMTGPTSLRNANASLFPGDITYVDERDGQKGFRAVHEINFNISGMESKQEQVRGRIQRAFFEDLFLMLANSDRRQITATEIDERREEKLLALGPVLERINDDLLDPLIDIAFAIHVKQGLIPPAPPAIEGADLKIEYLSIMAQAQKTVGIGGVERFAGFVGNLAAVNPDVLDKFDIDQVVDVYGDMTAVPPSIIRTDDDVAAMRQQRAEAQQAQEKAAMIQQAAGAAKDLSQASTDEGSLLSEVIDSGGVPGIGG